MYKSALCRGKHIAGICFYTHNHTGKNIKIIETCRISQTKYIQIVQIGGRYVAIAVSKDQVTSLGDVNKENLIIKDETQENVSFKDILEKFKGEKKG